MPSVHHTTGFNTAEKLISTNAGCKELEHLHYVKYVLIRNSNQRTKFRQNPRDDQTFLLIRHGMTHIQKFKPLFLGGA